MIRSLSKTTYILSLLIFASAVFIRRLFSALKARGGEALVVSVIGAVMLLLVAALIAFLVRNHVPPVKVAGSLVIVTLASYCVWRIPLAVERVHILQYALLGWFALRDLKPRGTTFRMSIMAFIVCLAVGIVDELIQWVLPYRVFDLKDIVMNGIGGLVGILLRLVV